jgi:cell division protein YceG involved in septum cleavage
MMRYVAAIMLWFGIFYTEYATSSQMIDAYVLTTSSVFILPHTTPWLKAIDHALWLEALYHRHVWPKYLTSTDYRLHHHRIVPLRYCLTIPEGYVAHVIMKTLQNHPALITSLPLNVKEGWFFPDTYCFFYPASADAIVKQAYAAMQKHLKMVWHRRGIVPYRTPDELLIAASIIEQEASAVDRDHVSAVIANRLYQRKRLEMDAIVRYGQLYGDERYNAYHHNGLPPTPINMPSIASLKAAAHPASSDALFFVTLCHHNNHHFSVHYAEHLQWVKRYRLCQFSG